MLLMRAVIEAERGYRRLSGNLPTDPAAAVKIKDSGFFRGFTRPPADLPKPRGTMQARKRRVVVSDLAAELVDFSKLHSTVTAEVADASYQCLIELMKNTHNHADGRGRAFSRAAKRRLKRELWIVSVYCQDGVAFFTFVDLGVGLLKSVAPKSYLGRLQQSVFTYGQPQLLQEMFSGRVAATVMEPGHGLGLPFMQQSAATNRLPGLHVLTSSATGEVSSMNFRSISSTLRGTVFRWRTGEVPVAKHESN
jgi:hypothetical protein